jgi:hypothetical protein
VRRVLSAAIALAACAPLVVNACDGQEGNPAAPMPSPSPTSSTGDDAAGDDATEGPPDAKEAGPMVTLGAVVQDLTTSAPIPNVLVVVEVGGLNQPNPAGIGPDGGAVATVAWDPFFQYGALTNDAGAASLSVPGGTVGLHAFADGYL